MILPLPDLITRYQVPVGTVLHLGAHLGEERGEYDRAGAREVVWVEADPDVFAALTRSLDHPGHRAVQAVVSDSDGLGVDFYVANNHRSSSLLRMKLHTKVHPNITVTKIERLTTTTVDTLCARERIPQPDLVVLDLQGAELLALRGAPRTLASASALYTEVATAELYEGCALVDELDAFLEGFVRMETVMTPQHWGDALYVARAQLSVYARPRVWFSPEKGTVVAV